MPHYASSAAQFAWLQADFTTNFSKPHQLLI
jgi:hypothetical protein